MKKSDFIKDMLDQDNCTAYLNEQLDSRKLKAFISGLVKIGRLKHKGMSGLEKKTKIPRQTLYNMEKIGNPTIRNLNILLKAVGYHLQVKIK